MVSVLYMPDGNRRFAEKNSISYGEAYKIGSSTLTLFAEFFVAEGRVEQLIYHAMSNYTHRRTDETVTAIFGAGLKALEDLAANDFFFSRNITFRAIEHTGVLQKGISEIIAKLESKIPHSPIGEVVVLMGYSLEQDMNFALARNPKSYQELRDYLLFPKIDLVLRNKEMQPSGGPVYAMDQAQMIILDKLNPEISREDLEKAWDEYQELKKRHQTTSGLFR